MAERVVAVPAECAEELAESFRDGQIIDDSGMRYLGEKAIATVNGLKVEIFANEHPPPHFRVYYAGQTANYAISDCRQLNGGLKEWYRNVRDWHAKNKQTLIIEWNAMRPSDCPVGEYRGDD